MSPLFGSANAQVYSPMSLDVPEIATKVLDCMDVQAFELRTLAPGTYSIFNVDVNSENLLGTFTETWSSFDPSQFVVVPGGLLSISVGKVIGEFVPASGATQSFNLQVYRLSIVSGTPSFLGSGFVERTFATRCSTTLRLFPKLQGKSRSMSTPNSPVRRRPPRGPFLLNPALRSPVSRASRAMGCRGSSPLRGTALGVSPAATLRTRCTDHASRSMGAPTGPKQSAGLSDCRSLRTVSSKKHDSTRFRRDHDSAGDHGSYYNYNGL